MKVTPLKRVADVCVSNVDKKSVDGQRPVRLCNYTDVYYRDTIAPDRPLMAATATREQIDRFGLRRGDVIITKDSETPEDIGVAAFVSETAPDLVCGYHLAILRPRPDLIDGRYLYWSMRSKWMRGQLASRATGVTRFGLRLDAIANALVEVPSLDEQRRIAGILDAETARLDAIEESLMAESASLREMLDLRILRGVAPGSRQWRSGDLLDGLSLAGEEPDWRSVRLKYTIRDVQTGFWGAEADGGPDDVLCIRVADFDYPQGRTRRACTLRSVPPSQRLPKLLRQGDLLLEKSGGGEQQPVGRVVLVDEQVDFPAVSSNFIVRMRPGDGFDPAYLQFLHRALYFSGMTRLSIKQTTGIQNLDIAHYLSRRVGIPEQRRQIAIRDELAELSDTVRKSTQSIAAQVALVDERREALISEMVSGGLDLAPRLDEGVAA